MTILTEKQREIEALEERLAQLTGALQEVKRECVECLSPNAEVMNDTLNRIEDIARRILAT